MDRLAQRGIAGSARGIRFDESGGGDVLGSFHEHVQHRIKGKAKAMIVTRSRLHAVRYTLALKRYLKEREMDYGVLVAFFGKGG